MVAVGAVAIGGQSLVATIRTLRSRWSTASPSEPADPTNKNGYILFGDSVHVSAPFGTYAA